ncbi:hypothetical protein [Marinobacter sp. CHS3-4]|uniref:hypothetical protein n=1 Tax=Marinobacter sp. CHS3-4 TaxID=3045174 RepID=UPI0024B49DC2|nr:hypothetical protein [Marinobacter sp. CHS3-4]MDI9246931.1 hypothetical protein [Marinobacter sp. CHS3-4]
MSTRQSDQVGPAGSGQNSMGADAETQSLKLLYGSYADVLFVLLPFAVVALFKVWDQGFESVLLGYDLSMAAGVLGGLAVVKFIMGMMIDTNMLKHKERILFLIAGTVFLIMVPGILFSVLIMLADPVPKWVMFVQPLLLVLGISAYSGAVGSTNAVHRQFQGDTNEDRDSMAGVHEPTSDS